MISIYERVAKWNSLRYERVYDKDLTLALLIEELNEAQTAATFIDHVDGLCDIIYVAYGAIWKLGTAHKQRHEYYNGTFDLIKNVPCNFVEPVEYISAYVAALTRDDADDLAILYSIIHLATSQMSKIGIDQATGMQCLYAVCDSNDSKSVQKTASDVKANQDKGPCYKPPALEPLLAHLMETKH